MKRTIVLLVAQLCVAASAATPAEAQSTPVWSATLVAKSHAFGSLGCDNAAISGKCSDTVVLTDDEFVHDSINYTFEEITSSSSGLSLVFASPADVRTALDALNFCVGGTAYAFTNATHALRRWATWNTGPTWSADELVSVSIAATCPTPAPTVTLKLSPTSISENGGVSTVTATLSGAASAEVTVAVSAAGAGLTDSTHFTLSANKTLTIAQNDTTSTGTVTITAVDNVAVYNGHSVTVSGTASGGGVSNPTSQTLTILDDDGTPTTVALQLSPAAITEDGGVSTVTATLSDVASADVTVTVSAAAVSPAVSGDFNLSTNKTLTIAQGQTLSTGTVTITAVNNNAEAADKTVTVSGVASGGGVSDPADQTLTIVDDDGTPPTVTLVLTPPSISEDGGMSRVTAELSGTSAAEVTVTVSAAAVSPAVSGDFNLSAKKTLTIPVGSTKTNGTQDPVTITAVNNNVGAADKTVTVSGSASGGGVSNPADQTLTITDDDGGAPTPTVSLVLTPASISEDGGVSRVTATLSGAAGAEVTVTVSTAAVSPAVTGDFNVSANKTLTIAQGSTTSTGAVTITAVNNNTDAANKTVTVSGTASGGGVSDPADQTLTIIDDDGTPPTVTLVLTPASISENGGVSKVTATLSGTSAAEVTVTVSAAAVPPAVAGDFNVSANKTLTIAVGSTTSTGAVTITAVDNNTEAADKTVTVSGSASGGGVSNPADLTLTITDDDGTPPPTVSLAVTPTSISENGGVSRVTATLSGVAGAEVTVTVSAAAVPPAVSGDFNLSANKTLTIAQGSTRSAGVVTITAVDNDAEAAAKTVTVSGSASGGGVSNPADRTLTITDDDGTVPTVSLVLSPASISEDGGVSRVTATLSGVAGAEVTVTVSAAAVPPAVSGDFNVSANKTLTIAQGSTNSAGVVTITAVDNNAEAADKSVTVSGTASGGGVSDPADRTLTITDDDGTPTVSPGAPTNLATAATTGGSGIEVSWRAPANTGSSAVARYVVYGGRSNPPSDSVGTSTSTEFTLTPVAPGTTYYFRVRAVNADGHRGPLSAVASFTTAGGADATKVRGLSGFGGRRLIALTWQAPAATQGLRRYRVQVASASGGPFTDLAQANATAYTHTDLPDGATRWYRVAAVYGGENLGTWSEVASATANGPPSAPRDLTATKGITRVKLRWQAPASTGGSPLTGYRIERSEDGGSAWTTVASVEPNATQYTHEEAVPPPGQTVAYRVIAINALGESPASEVAEVTSPARRPSAPRDVSASASGRDGDGRVDGAGRGRGRAADGVSGRGFDGELQGLAGRVLDGRAGDAVVHGCGSGACDEVLLPRACAEPGGTGRAVGCGACGDRGGAAGPGARSVGGGAGAGARFCWSGSRRPMTAARRSRDTGSSARRTGARRG